MTRQTGMTWREALGVVNRHLAIDPLITVRGDEIKCWVPGDHGRDKTYLTEKDCTELARAFDALALELMVGGSERQGEGSEP